jgi:DNA-binding NtrC family response regulator
MGIVVCSRCLEPLEGIDECIRVILDHGDSLRDLEYKIIRGAIKKEHGNVTKAAERLGIGRATIYRKLANAKQQGKIDTD